MTTNVQTEQRPVLTVGEMAELLGVSKLTIWRWEKSAEIPKAIAIGGTVRWKRSDVEKWLAEKK